MDVLVSSLHDVLHASGPSCNVIDLPLYSVGKRKLLKTQTVLLILQLVQIERCMVRVLPVWFFTLLHSIAVGTWLNFKPDDVKLLF